MNWSVSSKDEIWFLRVCHHISNAVYQKQHQGGSLSLVQGLYVFTWGGKCGEEKHVNDTKSNRKPASILWSKASRVYHDSRHPYPLVPKSRFSCTAPSRPRYNLTRFISRFVCLNLNVLKALTAGEGGVDGFSQHIALNQKKIFQLWMLEWSVVRMLLSSLLSHNEPF